MSKTTLAQGLFKPLSRAETKSETTTRIAREIDAAEKKAVDAKTARLRALRLAREEADAAAAAEAPPAAKRARRVKALG